MEGKGLLKRFPVIIFCGLLFVLLTGGLPVFSAGHDPKTSMWHVASDVNIRGVAGSRDQDHAFEDFWLKGRVVLDGSISKKEMSWQFDISWDRGQVLLYPWFFDLSSLKGSMRASGGFSDKRLHLQNVIVKGPIFLKARGITVPLKEGKEGTAGKFLHNSSVSSLQISGDVKRLYEILLKDPFSDSHPVLLKFDPSGSVFLKTFGKVLRLSCSSSIVYSGSPLIKGLALDLSYPFRGEGCEPGSISWNTFFLKNLLPQNLLANNIKVKIRGKELPVIICREKITAGPLDLDLEYGGVSLEKALFKFPGRDLSLEGIGIRDLHVERLVKGFPCEMKVSARGVSAELKRGRLVFSGRIRAEVAGGTITASNIWIEPFAPIVRYGADIGFENLDLGKLTEATSFGRVSGVVKGRITGLVMSGIQPERFDFLLENDESADAPKKISIKAVENLSILGGGQGSVSFLGYFFKEFSYRRMGISCGLKNDVFVLHGLIKKGGKEYLVERGLLGGVNVINMNPGGRIRFKDMVERLKRITETDNNKMEVR